MRIIQTEDWKPSDTFSTYQVYNGLDCCLTFEVFEEISRRHNHLPEIYSFTRAMQAPALDMMLRGLKVDIVARDQAIKHLEKEVTRLQSILNLYSNAIWGADLNPGSPKQMKDFLYGAMQLPEQYKRGAGGSTVTANRDALEKLDVYFHARPIIRVILAIRDRTKQISTLRSEVDSDRRMRTSYNVAGTETGRWSSSENAFGTGTNLQNIADKLRRIFIADRGRKLAYVDLEQAESRAVGIKCYQLFGATNYIDACESGDLHTITCKLVWPDELPWTGDKSKDRELAERPFYRDYSYRDMSKRGGHGTNYYGRDYTMAKHLKVETKIITRFQQGYFGAFPEIRWWHHWVAQQLQTEQRLTTFLGRERHFFGRPNDDTTLREAIAYEPQSVVGDLLNLAAWRIWKHGASRNVRLLAQLHDAVLVDYPDDDNETAYLDFVLDLMKTPLTLTNPDGESRTFIIGSDAATGWNWGKYNDDPRKGGINIGGIRKWKGAEDRTRPQDGGLHRVLPDFH